MERQLAPVTQSPGHREKAQASQSVSQVISVPDNTTAKPTNFAVQNSHIKAAKLVESRWKTSE